MLFSSPFFIFIFLPIALAAVALFNKKYHNLILLSLSIIFYAWGGLYQTTILVISIIVNYFFGLIIGNCKPQHSKLFLFIAIFANLIALSYFKYFNFFLTNLNNINLIGNWSIQASRIILPLGISFYTFHSISYLVDVFRQKVQPVKNIINLSLYITFFPQLIAGPIVRFIDVSEQIKNRTLTLTGVSIGMQRFIFGLAKKVIVANCLGLLAEQIMTAQITTLDNSTAWLGITAYTLQIYFDFSGYSDMAIGLAVACGFQFPENFNYPYSSKSIKQFWRSWHISLSTWFRDFLYVPLGGNKLGNARTNINLFIVFFCTGFWHGASWNFVIWGLFHGTFLFLERTNFGVFLSKTPKILQLSYTLLIVMIGWVFFKIENIATAFEYILKLLFINTQSSALALKPSQILNLKTGFIIIFATLYSLRFFRFIIEKIKLLFIKYNKQNLYLVLFQGVKYIISISLLLLCILYISTNTYNPFIYFRF